MNAMLSASNFTYTHVRCHEVQARPFRSTGQGTLGKSFPCLQEVFADSASWATA